MPSIPGDLPVFIEKSASLISLTDRSDSHNYLKSSSIEGMVA